jgi:hypothetical protein
MHTIRLRGPWSIEPLERYVLGPGGRYQRTSGDLPATAKMTMPADWGPAFGTAFLGLVRYQRIFQKPTGLESGERVWLVVDVPRSRGSVELNRHALGEAGGRFDITELLEDHNRLEVVVEHPALDANGTASDDGDTIAAGGLTGEVRLEIEE